MSFYCFSLWFYLKYFKLYIKQVFVFVNIANFFTLFKIIKGIYIIESKNPHIKKAVIQV